MNAPHEPDAARELIAATPTGAAPNGAAPDTDDEQAPGYWRLSRTLTYSLIFALPLFLLYEILALVVNWRAPIAVRNAADALLRGLFGPFGEDAEIAFFGALVAVAIALVVREHRRRPVPLRWRVFVGMGIESLVLAVAFGLLVSRLTAFVLSPLAGALLSPGGGLLGSPGVQAGASLWSVLGSPGLQSGASLWPVLGSPGLQSGAPLWSVPLPLPLAAGLQAATPSVAQMLVLSLGAGLYEELVFRVLLVTAVAWAFRQVFPASAILSGVFAVVVSALVFSAFHYVGPLGDAWTLDSFVFRFIGGVVFSTIYLVRGFGIVAWTHALYDVFLLSVLAVAG